MIITLEKFTEDYRIQYDGDQYTPQRRMPVKEGENKGKINWFNLGYYSKLDRALNKVALDLTHYSTEKVSLQSYIELLKDTMDKVCKACEEI